MQCGRFHAMEDHSHLLSIPILPLSSWCAAAQTLPVSQLLWRRRSWKRRRRRRRRRRRVGEYSLKKSWLRATAVSCPSLSSPAVHFEYSIHQKMVVNYASLPCWINDENSHTKKAVLGSYCSENFCLYRVLKETCGFFPVNSHPSAIHMGWCACKWS